MVKDKESSESFHQQYRLPSFHHHAAKHKNKTLNNNLKVLQLNLPYIHPRPNHHTRSRADFGQRHWFQSGDHLITLGQKIQGQRHVFNAKKRNKKGGIVGATHSLSSNGDYREPLHDYSTSKACKLTENPCPNNEDDYGDNANDALISDENINNTMADNRRITDDHVPDRFFYREKKINDAAQNISCRILLRYASEMESSPSKNAETRLSDSLPLIRSNTKNGEATHMKTPSKNVKIRIEIDEDYESYDIEKYLVNILIKGALSEMRKVFCLLRYLFACELKCSLIQIELFSFCA